MQGGRCQERKHRKANQTRTAKKFTDEFLSSWERGKNPPGRVLRKGGGKKRKYYSSSTGPLRIGRGCQGKCIGVGDHDSKWETGFTRKKLILTNDLPWGSGN